MLGGRFLSRSGNWPPPAERVAFYAARAVRHGLKSMNKNEEGHVRPPSQRVSDCSHSLGTDLNEWGYRYLHDAHRSLQLNIVLIEAVFSVVRI